VVSNPNKVANVEAVTKELWALCHTSIWRLLQDMLPILTCVLQFNKSWSWPLTSI